MGDVPFVPEPLMAPLLVGGHCGFLDEEQQNPFAIYGLVFMMHRTSHRGGVTELCVAIYH